MSIERKKGAKALTWHRQKRADRNVLTRRRWRAWRALTQPRYTRSPLERAVKGIMRPTQRQVEEAQHRAALDRIRNR
jgi:hypothetical protein